MKTEGEIRKALRMVLATEFAGQKIDELGLSRNVDWSSIPEDTIQTRKDRVFLNGFSCALCWVLQDLRNTDAVAEAERIIRGVLDNEFIAQIAAQLDSPNKETP